MRNVRNFTVTQTIKKTNSQTGSTSTTTQSRQSVRTQRSDSTSTTPYMGEYYVPTSYDAFFALTSTQPAEGYYVESLWPHTGLTRRYSYEADGGGDNGQSLYGVNASTLRPAVSAEGISRARAAAAAQIRSHDFNAGQFMFELRESARTLRQLAQGAMNLLNALRKPWGALDTASRLWLANRVAAGRSDNFLTLSYRDQIAREARNRQRMTRNSAFALADAYLGFMYGVRPFILDIYALLADMAETMKAPLFTLETNIADPNYGLPTSAVSSRTYKGTAERGVKIGATISIDNPGLFEVWNWGLTDPVSLAWELVPLSFVVDWFLHVNHLAGFYIRPQGWHITWGYETQWMRNNFAIQLRHTPAFTFPIIEGMHCWTACRLVSNAMSRLPMNTTLYPPIPYFSMDLGDITKAATIIALSLQPFR